MSAFVKKVKAYLHVPLGERIAAVLMVVVVATLAVLPFYIHRKATAPTIEELAGSTPAEKALFAEAAQTAETGGGFTGSYASNTVADKPLHPQSFDPNTVTEAALVAMGLPPKVAATWVKFRSRGGHFYRPDDIRKLYTLSPEHATALIPYAHVEGGDRPSFGRFDHNESGGGYPRKEKSYQVIDINTATQEEWEQLPMIGDYTAKQIIKHRSSLAGGFKSVEQVGSTYNLRPENFEAFKPYLRYNGPAAGTPKPAADRASGKIDLNKASRAQLLQCPVITNDIADAIIVLRQKKGPFTSADQLSQIVFIQPALLVEIKRCVEVAQP